MRSAIQRKTIEIDRGLFLVRYSTAEDAARPPRITVSTETPHKRSTYLVTHPDEEKATLRGPGACFVVRALKPSRLVIEVMPSLGGDSTAASVRVETLSQGGQVEDSPPQEREAVRSLDLDSFSLVGHVAGIGDVRVNPGTWLAGPSAPSRIEGISIEWPAKPSGLDLRYSVTTAKHHSISQQMVALGSYAGTRGKALALVGIALELVGAAALGVQLDVEATFLGAPAIQRRGPRVALTGPTGREPLVGLKVGLKAADASRPAPARPRESRANEPNRVRVFGGRAKPAQSAAL
jgi:hypothetical protein